METTNSGVLPTRQGVSRYQQKRRRSIGALAAGVSLATVLTLGSGLSGVLPGLSAKARAATTLTGLVYLDLNQNGVQDLTADPGTNEPGFANVNVTAFDSNGAVAGAATTLANGTWQIVTDNVGPFRVEFSNFVSTKIASGNRLGGTSVQFPTGGDPIKFTLFGKVNGLGELNDLLYETLEIGNRVWRDTNANGVQDPGEAGIPGVLVNLVDEGGDPAVNLSTNQVLPGVVTNADGEYYFTNVGGPRTYRVVIDASQPALTGLTLTTQFATANSGNVLNDSNGFYVVAGSTETNLGSKPIAVGSIVAVAATVGPGQNDYSFDFGFVSPVASTTTTAAPTTTTTTPWDATTTTTTTPWGTTTTTPWGTTTTTPAETTTTTGATTTSTTPETTTSTTPGETTTTTTAATTTTTAATTTTTAGTTTTTAATTTTTTPAETTTTAATTSTTAATTSTTAATTSTTTPAVKPAKLGDRVFIDTNRNGVQDPTEIGIVGAKVNLETCAGAALRSTLTIADGRYEFANLAPGQYRVRFELPTGYDFTRRLVGTDTGLDSDADQTSGVTGCVTLVADQFDPTVDAGLVEKPTVTTTPIIVLVPTTTVVATTTTVPTPTTPTIPVATGCIGDKVFEGKAGDKDGKGIPGITLVLITPDGVSFSTTTDGNGLYLFCTLKPGVYTVRVTVPPAGAKNIYTLDGKNNNATSVKLDAGRDNLDADFGYEPKNIQVQPTVVENPDFPETPVITPSVTGSDGTRQALAALAMILTGAGLVGLLRSRRERLQ